MYRYVKHAQILIEISLMGGVREIMNEVDREGTSKSICGSVLHDRCQDITNTRMIGIVSVANAEH